MIFKKLKKAHQSILQEWFKDKATRKHLGGMLPLENCVNYMLSSVDTLPYFVFENETPIGMVDLEFDSKSVCREGREKKASISLLINPNLRKKGLGTFLLNTILQLDCCKNCTHLDAFIDPDNIASIKCFQKAGFIKMNKTPDKDGMFLFSYFFK